MNGSKNIGFVSTRIAGTDGVSLEIAKWAAVLERNGFSIFYFSGENEAPPDKCRKVDLAHFLHPEIQSITRQCFGKRTRPRDLSSKIQEIKEILKEELYAFIRGFDLEILVAENALSIPLNIPLGLALTECIAETGIPTIGHHHDFCWERKRFLINGVNDYLAWAFPPNLPYVQHVVINSLASNQLSFRKGISNTVIPNVYDFSSPTPKFDASARKRLLEAAGLSGNDPFVLQPTRVVPRKQIERSLEIVHRMHLDNPVLVVSHSASDEEALYYENIQEYASRLGVKLVSVEHLVGGQNRDAGKPFSIGDVYLCADLVTYPSAYEGFGNAFLEAVYYRKPIVVNRYSIYVTDIEPKGFQAITLDGFVTERTLEAIREVLDSEERREAMTEENFSLGRKYFSFEVLERWLLHLVDLLRRNAAGYEGP